MTTDGDGAAWFAGTGTLNGAGEHYFIAEITESPDTIAIDIWPDGGVDGYDTGIADLGGGRIRIRTYDW